MAKVAGTSKKELAEIRTRIERAIEASLADEQEYIDQVDAIHGRFRLEDGTWGVDYDVDQKRWVHMGFCGCPLACLLLLQENPTPWYDNEPIEKATGRIADFLSRVSEDPAPTVAQVLGVDEDWIGAFLAGFDQRPALKAGKSSIVREEYASVVTMAAELREKYIPNG